MRRLRVGESLGAENTNKNSAPRRNGGQRKPVRQPPLIDPGPPPPEWQDAARQIIADFEEVLWSDAVTKSVAWLEARGLRDDILAACSIGYCPKDGNYHGLYVPKGIVIPWIVGDNIWKLNIRRPTGDPRYVAVKGSRNSLFRADWIYGHDDCFVVEGELDALLLWQEIRDWADVLTLGGASGSVSSRWFPILMRPKRFWIATDNDEAGEKAAKGWLNLTGEKGRRILPPGGAKDITEAWQKGENLWTWARSHIPAPMPRPILDLPRLQSELPISLFDLPDILDKHGIDGRVSVTPDGLMLKYWSVDEIGRTRPSALSEFE